MILYLCLYFLFLIGAYTSERSPFVLYVMFALMSLMIGYRGEEVGTDTLSYQLMYESLGESGYLGYPEPLYGLLCVGAYALGLSFQLFQTLLIFIALCMAAVVIRKQSPNYCLSMFLMVSMYFLFYTMNIYRELVACYISLYALYVLFNEEINKRKLKFVLLVIIAACIHKASLFLIPVMFLLKIELKNKLVLIAMTVTLLVGISDIGSTFLPMLGIYEKDLSVYARSGGKVIMALFLAIYWMIGFYYLYRNSDEELKESMYLKTFFCGILVNNLLVRHDMGLRLMLYFTLPLIIGIPLFVLRSNNYLKTQAIVVGYTSIYFIVFILANSADVIPYTINL